MHLRYSLEAFGGPYGSLAVVFGRAKKGKEHQDSSRDSQFSQISPLCGLNHHTVRLSSL